jgi:hypothetical protein
VDSAKILPERRTNPQPAGHYKARPDDAGGEIVMAANRSGAVIKQLRTLFSVGAVGALSDRHLLDLLVARRDEAAFSALIERHGPMVHRVARGLVVQPGEAKNLGDLKVVDTTQ